MLVALLCTPANRAFAIPTSYSVELQSCASIEFPDCGPTAIDARSATLSFGGLAPLPTTVGTARDLQIESLAAPVAGFLHLYKLDFWIEDPLGGTLFPNLGTLSPYGVVELFLGIESPDAPFGLTLQTLLVSISAGFESAPDRLLVPGYDFGGNLPSASQSASPLLYTLVVLPGALSSESGDATSLHVSLGVHETVPEPSLPYLLGLSLAALGLSRLRHA